MKKILFLAILLVMLNANSQVKVGNNPASINANSLLELEHTNKGLLLPRITAGNITLMNTAPDGMIIYNITDLALYIRSGGSWVKVIDNNTSFKLPYSGTIPSPSAYVLDIINSTGTAGYGAIRGQSLTEANGVSGYSASGNAITGSSNTGTGAYFSSNSGYALTTGVGKVGFGTTTPTYPLTVVSNGSGIVQKNGSVEVGTYASTASAYIQTYSSHPLYFATGNSTAQMALLTNGNFGIGTAVPTAKLSVNGTVKITDGTQADGKVLTSDAAGNATWQNTSFTNSERFMRTMGVTSNVVSYATTYNTSSNITIAGDVVTLNTPGLYHFEFMLVLNAVADYRQGSATPRMPSVNLSYYNANGAGTRPLAGFQPFYATVNDYLCSLKGTVDIYIDVPTNFTVQYNFTGMNVSSSNLGGGGLFSGYMIAN